MSNELAKIQPAGALGLGFAGSTVFRVKPQTYQLVQGMTQQEGAIPGKFRNMGTKQHFDELHVVMMLEPQQQRVLMQKGVFTKEGKICHSYDGIKPSDDAKVPQAMICEKCPKQDWTRYNAAKKRGLTGDALAQTKPECDKYWHVTLIDRQTRIPFYFNFSKTSVKPFESACQSIANMAAVMVSEGKNPNVFDFSFKIKPKKEAGKSFWTTAFSDFALMSEEDRAAFGGIYAEFIANRNRADESADEEADGSAIDAAVNEAPAAGSTGSVIDI